ncbi:hypothetical protein [Moritella sp. F3]|uniref:hypothetical protein n=1 Tax=Moritella sp. F3 TaxID=2718882 RepID=UPI0018E16366|nr:hypothetical protein [Moritella sp. F3]GIC77170.1 hypothetical protein FMO001_18970 [Moritella sp. F1]GIC82289.1 hypothetical protein FMO003_25700 [Moritella sp. F3]
MTEQKEKLSKDVSYNKKREPLFRVEISTADTAEDGEEMRQMKTAIVNKSGSAKKGVIDMYRFAKENGFFNKEE